MSNDEFEKWERSDAARKSNFSAYQAFKAGAASRDAEVAELQARVERLDELVKINATAYEELHEERDDLRAELKSWVGVDSSTESLTYKDRMVLAQHRDKESRARLRAVQALVEAEHSVEHLYRSEGLRYTGVVLSDDLKAALRGDGHEH